MIWFLVQLVNAGCQFILVPCIVVNCASHNLPHPIHHRNLHHVHRICTPPWCSSPSRIWGQFDRKRWAWVLAWQNHSNFGLKFSTLIESSGNELFRHIPMPKLKFKKFSSQNFSYRIGSLNHPWGHSRPQPHAVSSLPSSHDLGHDLVQSRKQSENCPQKCPKKSFKN